MSQIKIKTIILSPFLGLFLGLTGCSQAQTQSAPKPAPAATPADGQPIILHAEPAPAPLTPGPNDGSIAYITARLLEEFHYSQHPFDTDISKKFFDEYMNYLDPEHLFFLQSDMAEFSHYRTNLDTCTLDNNGHANVTPAFKIFARFMERVQQRTAYSDDLLKRDNFKFNTDERVELDRRHAPYPATLDDAKRLWREQVLFDFLREKLNLETNGPGAKLSESDFTNITQTLQRRYERGLRQFQEWQSSDVLQAYLDSLAHAYDPHSDYLNFSSAQNFSISMSLGLFGIGAELGMSDDGYCQIESLVPGGPAIKSNQLKVNDEIVAVAQSNQPPVDVVDMELNQIVGLIRGPKGTQVRLTIIPADDPKSRRVVTLIRAEINLKDEQAKSALIETPDGHGGMERLGIIDVPSFYAPVDLTGNDETANYISTDVATLVRKLVKEKVGGIILDLRSNPGGSLEEAVQFVGLFVTNGPVVQVRSPDNTVEVDGTDHALDLYHGPLMLMVNRLSASASEIVAAALQDYGRALVVGDTSTFGKGTVQNLDQLKNLVWLSSSSDTNDPGTVKITIRKFYRINGASTQLKGVVPDIVLPDVLSYSDEIGESSLPNALPWDTIPATNYVHLNDVAPYLTALSKDSSARVATNRDFAYMRQDIAQLEKLQTENSETLNERKAWDEKEKLDAQKTARDKEIASRKLPDFTLYEITLADAAKPGLPPPIKLLKAPADSGAVYQEVLPTNSVDTTPLTNAVPPDPMLDESERILEDYISLRQSNAGMVAKP